MHHALARGGGHNGYWMQQHLNENNESFRKKHIHPIFVRACHSAGFIVHGEYEKEIDGIVFECLMSKYHDEEKQKETSDKRERNVKDPTKPPVSRVRRTARPLKKKSKDTGDQLDDEGSGSKHKKACTFHFHLYWCESEKRWFLPRF